MYRISLIAIVGILLFLVACSTPKKKFDKGKYEQAFELALKKLNKGKAERSDKTILNKAYRALISERQDQAETMLKTNKVEQWELAYGLYDDLEKKYNEAQKYLVDTQRKLYEQVEIDKEDLEGKIVDTLMHIGHYNLDYAKKDDKKWLAQYAHDHFIKTQYYRQIPGIDTLLQQCIEFGTYIYIVEASADFASKYSWEIDRQFDDLEQENLDFIKIFYDRYVNNADCDFEIRFRNLDFETTERTNTNSYTKKVLDGYNTYIDSSGNEIKEAIYKEVEATVIERELTKTANWECAMDAKAITANCRKRDKYFNRSAASSIKRYDISGDQRAVPDQIRNAPIEVFAEEDDMVEELLENIYRDVLLYLDKRE